VSFDDFDFIAVHCWRYCEFLLWLGELHDIGVKLYWILIFLLIYLWAWRTWYWNKIKLFDHNLMCITWGISFCSVCTFTYWVVKGFAVSCFYSAVPGRYSDTISLHPLLCVYRLVLFERKLILLCYSYLQQRWKRISKCGKKWKEVLSMVRSVVYVQRLTWIQPMAVCVTQPSTGARMNHIRKLVQNTSRYRFCSELVYKI